MRIPRSAIRAFSLIEVTLALGVISFCLVTLSGLLPIGLKSNETAVEQTAANGILSAVCTDLRSTPATTPPGGQAASQQFGVAIPAATMASGTTTTLYFTGDGQFTATMNGPTSNGAVSQSRYLLTVTFPPRSASAAPRAATLANLQVSWPAAAAVQTPGNSVQTFIALDRN